MDGEVSFTFWKYPVLTKVRVKEVGLIEGHHRESNDQSIIV